MEFYFDLATNRLVTTAGGRGVLRSQEVKRGDGLTIELRFYRGDDAASLEAGWEITMALKEDFAGEALALVTGAGWSEAAGVYTAELDLNTDEMLAALAGAAFLDTLGEISIKNGAGVKPQSSQTVTFKVRNDVIKGDEGTPTSLPDALDWLRARAPWWQPELTLATLDAVVTAGIPENTLIALHADEGGNWNQLRYFRAITGAIPADAPGYVTPLDYATSGLRWVEIGASPRHNATNANPTVNDDVTMGYGTRSTWYNTATKRHFRCLSAADGAAVWVGTVDELDTAAATDRAGVVWGVDGKRHLAVWNQTDNKYQGLAITGAGGAAAVGVYELPA